MIYLASPYSDPDPHVREQRFESACRTAANLIRNGRIVFCPVAHSHPIARHGLPTDWDFWERTDRRYLNACDELVVLMLPGWRESRGVQAEMQIAEQLGKPVSYLMPQHGVTSPTLAPVAKELDR